MPSVRINEDGLCNLCSTHYEACSFGHNDDEELSSLIKANTDKKYQIILAYSGGKDSTYSLKMIRERYDASVLAFTFDNGFLSDECLKNIRTVTDNLGVDSIIAKYPANKMINAFKYIEDGKPFPRQSMERASAICNMCIMFIKNLIYYEAIIRRIPIICFGWTPGQVMTSRPLIRLNYKMVLKGFDSIKNIIIERFGANYERYFLNDAFMRENETHMPYLYYPFVKNNYNEESAIEEIKEIGWIPPKDTDGNSSNCLLNSYANQCHITNFGYHPYAFEISNLVREGYLTREEGLSKIEHAVNPNSYKMICEQFERITG
jgi:tRNA(Ile)-lysidine synthase TilS/MesJ